MSRKKRDETVDAGTIEVPWQLAALLCAMISQYQPNAHPKGVMRNLVTTGIPDTDGVFWAAGLVPNVDGSLSVEVVRNEGGVSRSGTRDRQVWRMDDIRFFVMV